METIRLSQLTQTIIVTEPEAELTEEQRATLQAEFEKAKDRIIKRIESAMFGPELSDPYVPMPYKRNCHCRGVFHTCQIT